MLAAEKKCLEVFCNISAPCLFIYVLPHTQIATYTWFNKHCVDGMSKRIFHAFLVFFLQYGKGSKIFNKFLLLFCDKMLVISTGCQIANWEDSDQTASSEAV